MPKRKRGTSLLEALYPQAPDELVRTAKAWVADSSDVMLDLTWKAYDALLSKPNLKTALAAATDDIERGLTRLVYFELDDLMSGNEPFRLLPEGPEDESRKKPPARPRAYDIAFVMRANPRIMWPIEAKVLPTPNTLADYIATLKERYLTGDYSPFVAEGAMVGYLLKGVSDETFKAIAIQLSVRLIKSKRWHMRPHRVSMHRRQISDGKAYPVRFRCHHLLMSFT